MQRPVLTAGETEAGSRGAMCWVGVGFAVADIPIASSRRPTLLA